MGSLCFVSQGSSNPVQKQKVLLEKSLGVLLPGLNSCEARYCSNWVRSVLPPKATEAYSRAPATALPLSPALFERRLVCALAFASLTTQLCKKLASFRVCKRARVWRAQVPEVGLLTLRLGLLSTATQLCATLPACMCVRGVQVPEGGSGVLVVRVDPLSDAAGAIQENDVLLEVRMGATKPGILCVARSPKASNSQMLRLAGLGFESFIHPDASLASSCRRHCSWRA